MVFIVDFFKKRKIMDRKVIVFRSNLIFYEILGYIEDREIKYFFFYLERNMGIMVDVI